MHRSSLIINEDRLEWSLKRSSLIITEDGLEGSLQRSSLIISKRNTDYRYNGAVPSALFTSY